MEEADKEGVQIEMDVVAGSSSNEMLAPDTDISTRFSHLETKKKSRLYNYLYGPYRQHQFLVDCIQELKAYNHVDSEVKGRMLRVAPSHVSAVGRVFSQLLWYFNIGLPFLFIALGFVCYNNWLVCCCAVFLCVLISGHSIFIFFVLHNQKISLRQWFVSKMDLEHYFGRENQLVKVRLDNATSMQFLSAGQKSRVILQLARSRDKEGVMMMCTRSFWTGHVLDPLLGFLFLLSTSLIALIVNVDLIRKQQL